MSVNNQITQAIELMQEMNLLMNSMLLESDRTSHRFLENRKKLDNDFKCLGKLVEEIKQSDAAVKSVNQTINETSIKTPQAHGRDQDSPRLAKEEQYASVHSGSPGEEEVDERQNKGGESNHQTINIG
jgi:hypothetical protein